MRQAIVISMSVTVVLTGFVRFDLKAKDPARQENSPPAIASETKAGSGKEPAVPKGSLRYDGKSFGEWRKELETELKADRQVEAIKAFAAFGSRGYGKEATEVILNVMRKIPYGGRQTPHRSRRADRRGGNCRICREDIVQR